MGDRLTCLNLERAINIVGSVVCEPLSLTPVGDAGKPAIFRANTPDKSLFVRVMETSKLPEIRVENELISFAKTSGVASVQPSDLASLESGFLVAWRPWIDGVVDNSISEDCAREIGKNLGILHTSDRINFFPRFFQYHNFCSIEHIKWIRFLEVTDGLTSQGGQTLQRIIKCSMNCIAKVHSKYGYLFECKEIVHGDVHGGNIVSVDTNPSLLDWESSGVGAAIIDLSVANCHFCFGGKSVVNCVDNSLLREYSEHGKEFDSEELVAGLFVSGLSYFIHDLMGLVLVMRGFLDRELSGRAENHFSLRLPELRRFLDWCGQTKSLPQFGFDAVEIELALFDVSKELGFFEVLEVAKARSVGKLA